MKLVLLRHGESEWNKENRFTGWTDIDLTIKGIEEAKNAGKLLKAEGFTFNIAYTSVLKRAIHTLWYVMDEMDLAWIQVDRSWRLNEKSYGALQGLNKAEMRDIAIFCSACKDLFLIPLQVHLRQSLHSGCLHELYQLVYL